MQEHQGREGTMNDLILQTISRFVLPLIQVYGFYIVLHGHLSPGGGFAGGTVLALSMILYTLVFGLKQGQRKLSDEAVDLIRYISIGYVGALKGSTFLLKGIHFPLGKPGALFSSGLIFLVTFGVGIKVAGTVLSLFNALVEEEE